MCASCPAISNRGHDFVWFVRPAVLNRGQYLFLLGLCASLCLFSLTDGLRILDDRRILSRQTHSVQYSVQGPQEQQ